MTERQAAAEDRRPQRGSRRRRHGLTASSRSAAGSPAAACAERRRRPFAARDETWLLAAVLSAALAACGSPEPRSSTRQELPLPFEFTGCERVLRGPVCALGERRRVRLWIGPPPGAVILIDARPPAAPPEPVVGGLRVEVEVPPGARETVVEARLGARRWTARLAVAGGGSPEWFAAARTALGSGDLAAARQLVAPGLAAAAPAERGLALMVAARVDLAGGDPARGEQVLRQAIRAHRRSGDLAAEIRDTALFAYRLIGRREFTAARAWLDALPDPAGHADSGFLEAYHLGLLASHLGDLRTGLRQMRAAEDHAARAGLVREQVMAAEVLARELQRVGRAGASRAIFAALESRVGKDLPPCDRAQLRNNRAWASILAREAGAPAADPRPLLAEVLRLFEEQCAAFAAREDERLNVRINLALANLQAGDVAAARRWLAEARRLRAEPGATFELWLADLEARALLAGGEARRALAIYQGLAQRARAVQSPESAWRAAYGEARAHEALRDVPGALAAYAAAERQLERESLLVAVDEGRDTFVGQREDGTRRHLDLLLREGRDEEALVVARRARSRALRDLRLAGRLASLAPAERAAWERAIAAHAAAREELDRAAEEAWRLPAGEARRAAEEAGRRLRALRGAIDALLTRFDAPRDASGGALAAPAAGEVLLVYHPLPEGWVGFAADAHGVVARRLGRLDAAIEAPVLLAERLLAPFATPIRRARRVRVLPYGALRAVDFHALPFGGEALLAARPVVYGLDLAAAPAAAPGATGGERALVVGDPRGDLPGARTEARRVRAALTAGRPGWTTELLLGREATGPAVRRALAGSALFHYAGHAVAAGWESSLPLAGGGRLTVDDVVARPRVARWVVLSGCATGATSAESAGESMGLAHAFLSAGAEAVVAAARPLADREAAVVVAAFYAELARAGSPEEALRRAQLAVRGRGGAGAWASFRVFVP